MLNQLLSRPNRHALLIVYILCLYEAAGYNLLIKYNSMYKGKKSRVNEINTSLGQN